MATPSRNMGAAAAERTPCCRPSSTDAREDHRVYFVVVGDMTRPAIRDRASRHGIVEG